MSSDGGLPGGTDSGALAHDLAPAIGEACDGRLGPIRWFRADWQRGGASTGYSTYRLDDGTEAEVVVKLPIGPVEHRVLTGLCETDAPTPRVAAHGTELGGYDLAWVVMERCPGHPISKDLTKPRLRDLAAALGAYYAAAERAWPLNGQRRPAPDWGRLLDRARAAVHDNDVPSGQKWNTEIKRVQKALPDLVERWESRDVNAWSHGDFHPGNALIRPEGSPWGPPGVVLIDFAEVHGGHWVEDALYLERLYWGHEDSLHKVKPVSVIARARRDNGLATDDDYGDLANVRRVLTAACVPAFLHREGQRAYMAAALDRLERLLPVVGA